MRGQINVPFRITDAPCGCSIAKLSRKTTYGILRGVRYRNACGWTCCPIMSLRVTINQFLFWALANFHHERASNSLRTTLMHKDLRY